MSSFPEIPRVSSLCKRPHVTRNQILLKHPENCLFTSDGLWSESDYVLWTIDKSWFTQDALGQKPDCFDVSKEHEYRIKNIFKYFSTNW